MMAMIKEHEYLKEGILNYLNMDSSGALMVTGPWGCGKSYFFDNNMFATLKESGYKPVRISLFGMSTLNDLPKNLFCESAQYFTDNKKWKKVIGIGSKCLRVLDKIRIPTIGDYVDLKGIFGEGKALYKFLPKKTVVCLDDLERAIERFDINDMLGVINDLVENQKLKVIVIANKKQIDDKQASKEKGTSSHKVFYEKVIEKVLYFTPDINGVFESILLSNGYGHEFVKFMNQECIKESIDPSLAKNLFLKHQKENIRTLKFAVSHFYIVFQDYINHKKDISDQIIQRQLVNQWFFLYFLSLESKYRALSIDDCMGLDKYVHTATINQIDVGDAGDDISPNDDTEDEGTSTNIANHFVGLYYKGRESEYIFYPYLYNLVVAGVNYDFDTAFSFAEKACERFDYRINPAQEIMDKWMGGYWKMADNEAKDNLLQLKKYVAKGELLNFPSFYNASVFLFKFCSIIDTTIEELKPMFDQGLRIFADKTTVNAVQFSIIRAIEVESNNVCKPVYDQIITVMQERMKEQKAAEMEDLKVLFAKDLCAFTKVLLPSTNSNPNFLSESVLQHIDEDIVEKKISEATAEEVMNLYCLLEFRYANNRAIHHIKDELPFIEHLLKYASKREEDKKRFSSCVTCDILLPLLRKVKEKLLS